VWFRSSADFDRQIRERFEPAIHAAAHGELSAWEEAPRSCVSLVVVLDQFPRNAYRNTAAAFAYDELALAVAKRALAAGCLRALTVPERAFLLMPYEHVEDAPLQREGVQLFARMAAEAPPQWRAFAENALDFARRHCAVIDRFGRFPYRNAVLGRTSTPLELEYLDSRPATFGQGG
jgi:uncharacterized protein (DUF924 family)